MAALISAYIMRRIMAAPNPENHTTLTSESEAEAEYLSLPESGWVSYIQYTAPACRSGADVHAALALIVVKPGL